MNDHFANCPAWPVGFWPYDLGWAGDGGRWRIRRSRAELVTSRNVGQNPTRHRLANWWRVATWDEIGGGAGGRTRGFSNPKCVTLFFAWQSAGAEVVLRVGTDIPRRFVRRVGPGALGCGPPGLSQAGVVFAGWRVPAVHG